MTRYEPSLSGVALALLAAIGAMVGYAVLAVFRWVGMIGEKLTRGKGKWRSNETQGTGR